MNPVYFQHIDATNESTFLSVVKLLFIDDTDPDMVLYYFDDNTKCNKLFIADATLSDDKQITQYVYVQLQNKYQLWKCNKKEFKAQKRQATTASGEVVEIPDLHMTRHDGGIIEDSIKYEFIPPTNNPSYKQVDLLPYTISYIKDNLVNKNYDVIDADILANIPDYYLSKDLKNAYLHKDEVKQEETPSLPEIADTIIENYIMPTNDSLLVKDLENHAFILNDGHKCDTLHVNFDENDTRTITFDDNGFAGIIIDDEWHSLKEIVSIAEQKFIEDKTPKVNEQQHSVTQKIIPKNQTTDFLNNMIQAATKKEATANVEITLEVPPFDVYKLLKTAYPEDWAKIFIDIIATSVPVDALQDALASGLEGYYNVEIENNIK